MEQPPRTVTKPIGEVAGTPTKAQLDYASAYRRCHADVVALRNQFVGAPRVIALYPEAYTLSNLSQSEQVLRDFTRDFTALRLRYEDYVSDQNEQLQLNEGNRRHVRASLQSLLSEFTIAKTELLAEAQRTRSIVSYLEDQLTAIVNDAGQYINELGNNGSNDENNSNRKRSRNSDSDPDPDSD